MIIILSIITLLLSPTAVMLMPRNADYPDYHWSSGAYEYDSDSLYRDGFGNVIMSNKETDRNFCSGNHFTCGDGTCIPIQWECDWYWDCPDNTDEHAHCQYEGEILCGNNKLVPAQWVCDGFSDCVNGEDEETQLCADRTSCTGRLCDNNMKCIHDDELCNGVFDCKDHTDEAPLMCDVSDCFLCDNGDLCIYLDWRCDGIADCNDISDEVNQICGPVSNRCWEGAFPCKHNHFCVKQNWRCDGENDCGDLSDELNCERPSSWYVHQGWTRWDKWSDCSTDCGEGVRIRHRVCNINTGLKTCHGQNNGTKKCTSHKGCSTELGADCGHKHTDFNTQDVRVVGGKKAVHGDWPWQAQLIWLQNGHKHVTCGATLIHQRIVLGAAHCFIEHMNDATRWLVQLGKHDVNTNFLTEFAVQRRITNIIIHPKFSTRTLQNDVAVLVLDSPVVDGPTKHIRWPCLDAGIGMNGNLDCFISGWGVTEMGGKQPSHLKEARMPILDRNDCNKPNIYNGLIKSTMLCAGHMEGGTDACQGDSGGPLSCRNHVDGLWYLVGITSWGHGCALPKRPGIFTSVAYFNSWIVEQINKYIK